MPLSPGWAKNVSRRVLWAALEKDLARKDREAMDAHFEGRCAYCGNDLGERWHADHLVSGGTNHISNRVPACARCNEHEKRDRDWVEFLAEKCAGDAALLQQRTSRLLNWCSLHAKDHVPVTAEQRRIWEEECNRVAAAIDVAHQRIRQARNAS